MRALGDVGAARQLSSFAAARQPRASGAATAAAAAAAAAACILLPAAAAQRAISCVRAPCSVLDGQCVHSSSPSKVLMNSERLAMNDTSMQKIRNQTRYK